MICWNKTQVCLLINKLVKKIALWIVVKDRTNQSEHAESVLEATVRLKVLSNILQVHPYNRIHLNFKMMTKVKILRLGKISIIKKIFRIIRKNYKITISRMMRRKHTKKISNFLWFWLQSSLGLTKILIIRTFRKDFKNKRIIYKKIKSKVLTIYKYQKILGNLLPQQSLLDKESLLKKEVTLKVKKS